VGGTDHLIYEVTSENGQTKIYDMTIVIKQQQPKPRDEDRKI
jgi:hypothetical protein